MKNNFTVIRDTREKSGNGWFFEVNGPCVGTVEKKLDTGDYSLVGYEEVLCIERKNSIGELAGNCSEKRFNNVLERMSRYRYPFIICEFEYDCVTSFPMGSNIPVKKWKDLRITNNYLVKFIADIQVKYGINIIFAGGETNAKVAALSIFKRVNESYGKN